KARMRPWRKGSRVGRQSLTSYSGVSITLTWLFLFRMGARDTTLKAYHPTKVMSCSIGGSVPAGKINIRHRRAELIGAARERREMDERVMSRSGTFRRWFALCFIVTAGAVSGTLWIRGYFVADTLAYYKASGDWWLIESNSGAMYLSCWRVKEFDGAADHLAYYNGKPDVIELYHNIVQSRLIPIKFFTISQGLGVKRCSFIVVSDWCLFVPSVLIAAYYGRTRITGQRGDVKARKRCQLPFS